MFLEAHNGAVEAQHEAVQGQLPNSYKFADPDQHPSEKSDLVPDHSESRIRIRVKVRNRIRIRINVNRISRSVSK